MSDWKEDAIKRKNFRRSKEDPEVCTKAKTRKKKFRYKLVVKNFKWFGHNKRGDYIYKKYEKKAQAQQALKSRKLCSFWGKYDLQIEEI